MPSSQIPNVRYYKGRKIYATNASLVLLGNFVVVEDNFCNTFMQRDREKVDPDNSRREAGQFTGCRGDFKIELNGFIALCGEDDKIPG